MCDEAVPCVAAGIDDIVVIIEYSVSEEILAQVLPDIFDGIEFGAIGRQMKDADGIGDLQFSACLVPSGPVENENGMASGLDLGGDFGQMLIHGLCVGAGHDKGGPDIACGADSTEDIGPGIACVLQLAGPAALVGPGVGECSLLPDAGLILPP